MLYMICKKHGCSSDGSKGNNNVCTVSCRLDVPLPFCNLGVKIFC